MEAVPPHTSVPERGRQRQALRHLRQTAVEGRVEAGDLGHARDPPRRRLERGDLGREVERGERHEGAELGQQRVVDECGAIVVRPAMDDAVADHLQPATAGEAVQDVVERGVRPVADDLDRAPVDQLLGVTRSRCSAYLSEDDPLFRQATRSSP